MAIRIELTQGKSTIIDDEFVELAQHKWCAMFNPNYGEGGAYMAARNIPTGGGKYRITQIHRLIMEAHLGRKLLPEEEVDHKNLNTLDNRLQNLRVASSCQNGSNRRKPSNNTSGYKGVSWHIRRSKWHAQIWANNVSHSLGYFDDPEEAHKAYCQAADELHGEFKNYGR